MSKRGHLTPETLSKRGHPATPLEEFIRSRGLRAQRVAAEARVSRQHLLRIRAGRMEPTRPVMVRIARACARLAAERVSVADLFDLSLIDVAGELEAINPS